VPATTTAPGDGPRAGADPAPDGPHDPPRMPSGNDVPVEQASRAATLVDEGTPLPEAWAAVHDDPAACGIVVRDGHPVAVVTAGALAERWPGGGPLVQARCTVGDVLERPSGVELLDPSDSLRHAAHRLLASGLPGLPVRSAGGGAPRVVTVVGVLAALLRAEQP
jgi:CBS domain-containing protein